MIPKKGDPLDVPPRPARDWREIVEIALFPVLLVGIIVVVVVFGTPPPTP